MPLWRKILWSVFYFLMVATADIGNMIGNQARENQSFFYPTFSVIWIVMSNARMRSVTNYFIINLSMADIINATFNVIPNFTYMLTGNWPFGGIFLSTTAVSPNGGLETRPESW
jgi:tachykinin receptor 3